MRQRQAEGGLESGGVQARIVWALRRGGKGAGGHQGNFLHLDGQLGAQAVQVARIGEFAQIEDWLVAVRQPVRQKFAPINPSDYTAIKILAPKTSRSTIFRGREHCVEFYCASLSGINSFNLEINAA